MCCEFEGETPELIRDDARPSGHGVKEYDACFHGDRTNVPFGKAILLVGTSASKGLASLLAMENLGLKLARLVDAVVIDVYIV